MSIRWLDYLTETPRTINEIIHVDIYVNSKQSFIIFIDKFSKHATCLHILDRNQRTLENKIREFIALKGKPKQLVFDNEFNIATIKNFLQEQNIQYHATKPNSHTGNSDIERLNNTLTEKIRTLNLEEKLPITTQITKAITLYNNNFHSTIKCTPLEVQNFKINHDTIYERLIQIKHKRIGKANEKRETYNEIRDTGFIKNYKNVRHKEQPKYRKSNLQNIHTTNIKRPFKFTGSIPANANDDNSPNQGISDDNSNTIN